MWTVLFLLYLNDLVNINLTPNIAFYADDMKLFLSGENLSDIRYRTSAWLEQLEIWLVVNQLKLNATKTKYFFFARNKGITQNILIKYQGSAIERTISHKCLGVYVDEHLRRGLSH